MPDEAGQDDPPDRIALRGVGRRVRVVARPRPSGVMETSSDGPRGDEVFSTRLLSALLALPASTLVYEAGRRIAAMRPTRYVLELDVNASTVHDAILDGVVEGGLSATAHSQIGRRYDEGEDRLTEHAENAVFELRFRGAPIEVVLLTFVLGDQTESRAFVIASLDVPCLYVKRLIAQYRNDHEGLRRIFSRARMMAPCPLVFEDLESVLSEMNRSFFLNELDGFAENTGIVVLATTNYPEQIDPAIIDRPSRFDRKYLFDLPSSEERAAYLTKWNDSLVGDMRVAANVLDRAAAQTGGFSFAYLKELAMSATMRWMELAGALSMNEVLPSLVASLKEQVNRGRSPGSSKSGRRVGLVPEA